MSFVGRNLYSAEDTIWDDPSRLPEAALHLLGKFSQVQSLCDHLVSRYLVVKAPGIEWLVQKRVLTTMRDEDRMRAVREIAVELSSADHLANAPQAFNQLKDARDHLGHSATTSVLLDAQGWFLHVNVPADDKRAQRVGRLNAPAFGQLFVTCDWLFDQLYWTGEQAGLFTVHLLNGEQAITEQPPLTPPRWQPGHRLRYGI
ncbi:hypothetical protein AB2L28_20520 [Kineococcus sp. TBRC 1896]|uniref:Uncharacterized protein n=1 Tax=Kineococcus mangrovi TaxID=1660183 RepID=A0ABV4I7H1_9ACTN